MRVDKIIVTSDLYQDFQKILSKKNLEQQFRFKKVDEITKDDVLWADALVGFKLPKNFEFGNIKWVHSIGAGVDGFLFNRKWDPNVLLTRTICSFGKRISEYCLSYILRDLQYHKTFAQLKNKKHWKPIEPKLIPDQKFVIYGTGEIGKEIARHLDMLGAKPFGVSLSGKEKKYFNRVVPTYLAKEIIDDADWIINTLPLTKETYLLFNKEFLHTLNQTAFINVGRGASVDESALIEAMKKGKVRLAVLDVFSNEPLPENSKLWEMSDVWITPHISAVTTPEEGVNSFIDTLKRLERNEQLFNKVNIDKGY